MLVPTFENNLDVCTMVMCKLMIIDYLLWCFHPQDSSLDLGSSGLAGGEKASEPAKRCLSSGPTGEQGERKYSAEEPERKVLRLSETLQGEMARKPDGKHTHTLSPES